MESLHLSCVTAHAASALTLVVLKSAQGDWTISNAAEQEVNTTACFPGDK